MNDQPLDRPDHAGRPAAADLVRGLIDTGPDRTLPMRPRLAALARNGIAAHVPPTGIDVDEGAAARVRPGGRPRPDADALPGQRQTGPGENPPERAGDQARPAQEVLPDITALLGGRSVPGEPPGPTRRFGPADAHDWSGARQQEDDAVEPFDERCDDGEDPWQGGQDGGIPFESEPGPRRRAADLGARLPAALRGAVWDPAARGAIVLALVALAAAAVAAFFAWHGRPVRIDAATDGSAAHSTVGTDAPAAGAARSGVAQLPPSGAGRSPTPAAEVVVDVAGLVRQPGVVRLPAGARVIDAIQRAGGVLPGTDTTGLALARPLVDGEQILVDGKPGPAPGGPSAGAAGTGGVGGAGGTGSGQGQVHLNTATAEQLDTLPGIGPVLAARIVQYREENGPFASPEQLAEVPGVGDRRLAELLPLITL